MDDAVMTQCFVLSPVLITVTRIPDERFLSYEFLLPFTTVPRTARTTFIETGHGELDGRLGGLVRGSVPELDDIGSEHLLYLVDTYQMNLH